eukprot:scaffold3120_cov73-Cylindrotheca_fusiformis.AAC.5
MSPQKESHHDVEIPSGGDGDRSPHTNSNNTPENHFDPFKQSTDSDDMTVMADIFDGTSVDGDSDDDSDPNRMYYDPSKPAVLNDGVHEIPGSPWAKPANNPNSRPTEPLPIAKYTSSLAFVLAFGWYDDEDDDAKRTIVDYAILSFFGLFWNSYFTVSSIFKCFIPSRAFRTNTKYCSVIPEEKPPRAAWSNVTIQIPLYKESLQEVIIPTLKSCMKSRDYYNRKSGAKCNIVICDDGIMAMLKNNFAAAEMLWETIGTTQGKIFKLSQLLQQVPRPSRRHLKGLKSHSVYEVFHRMLYYYHNNIGFVARSTWDRRGKFKKASNLNTHLKLVWGAEQVAASHELSMEEALIEVSHNDDGSRDIMFGNDVSIGHLIVVNDADARMSEGVIFKTVPEFLNDRTLGFTQHATKTLDEQRGESYYCNMLSAYTDALYQGHFLLSSILGCHPPLVGHSIFLRSEAVRQCGRIRTLRKTQRWLNNIGLPFLTIDQVGLSNLKDHSSTEYWSECHVSEDFELMIHLYNLGFNGRYVAYPGCEFQEGITRTFDEEAGRHRKFALGAHELMFNPINSWISQGLFSPLFKMFLRADIPSYYKIYLTAYLFSYTSGGAYLLVFSIAAIARIAGTEQAVDYIYTFNSAGVLVMSVLVYYIIGYTCFLITMVRMHWANKNIFFTKYRQNGVCHLVYKTVRYCMLFQVMFYSVMGMYFFLGSMDHLLSKTGVVGATNKDSVKISRCTAFMDTARFNMGSWLIAIYLIVMAYLTVLQDEDWDVSSYPTGDQIVSTALFAGPPVLIALFAFIVPIIMNPHILGWPFYPPFGGCCGGSKSSSNNNSKKYAKPSKSNQNVVDLNTFMTGSSPQAEERLEKEIERLQRKPDVELGSLATNEMVRHNKGNQKTSGHSGKTTKRRTTKAKAAKAAKKPPSKREHRKAAI